MDIEEKYLCSKAEVLDGIKTMNSFGTRLTGSKGQSDFIAYLKDEISKMGLRTYSDLYSFDRWEERKSSLTIHSKNGDENIHVSSVWPYSGETGPLGVTGELVEIVAKHINYLPAKNKIAVVKIKDFQNLPSAVAFNQRRSFPEHISIPPYYKGPVCTSFVKFPFLSMAKIAGVKAVICVWEGMSDAMVEGQYLPFILDYQGMPCIWVNKTDGKKVLESAKNHEKATLVLDAHKEKSAKTESFYAVIEGKNKEEGIIINTHTDGTNCVEENGAIAILAMMKYLKNLELDRTLIFLFVTGHFRLPNFKQNDIQATSKWLKNHHDMWDGKNGHINAVAGVSVEHLGCSQWKDNESGNYVETDPIDIELTYTGNKAMDDIYYEAIEGRNLVRTVTLKGHNALHFGEGQPLRNVGIPEIALVTAPDYLTAISENHHMDKFNLELMYEQIQSFIKMVLIIDKKSARELGKPEPYSLFLGSTKTTA